MQLKNYLLALGLSVGSLGAARAITCPNAAAITGDSVMNRPVVCGTANDINSSNVTVSCGDTTYYRGFEALYVWTPSVTGQTTITIGGGTSAPGIFVFQGCPTSAGAICQGSATGSALTKSLSMAVTAGTQYYILFDVATNGGSVCSGGSTTYSITTPIACTGTPTAAIATTAEDTLCIGGTTAIKLNGQNTTGGVAIQWQVSTTSPTAGFSSIAGATDTTYATPAINNTTYYRARLTCPFSNDSSFSNVLTIRVRPLPVVNLGNDTTVCGNVQSLVLNAGNPGSTFMWMGSTTTTQTLNVAPFLNSINNATIVANPSYQAAVTVTDAFGCVNRDTIRINVKYSPRLADYIIDGLDPTLTYTPVGDSVVTSYAWSFGDGGTANTRVATRTYAATGIYNVRLVVSNTNGCGNDTVEKQVEVIVTSVQDAALAASVLLYPNPTSAEAVLEVGSGATLRSVRVISATGALVMNESAAGSRITLRTADLAAGIYTLRIQLDKGVVVRKLQVTK